MIFHPKVHTYEYPEATTQKIKKGNATAPKKMPKIITTKQLWKRIKLHPKIQKMDKNSIYRCQACKGAKHTKILHTKIPCYHCEGKGIVDKRGYISYLVFKKMMCECQDSPYDNYDDNHSNCLSERHEHCVQCGLIVLIS